MSPILGILASSNYQRVTSSYYSIATTTVGSGGASSITFSSIPSTYTHLQIRGIVKMDSGAPAPEMRFNGDTGANYSAHLLYGTGAAAGATGQTSKTYIEWICTASSAQFAGCVIDILDYTNTSKNKTVRSLSGADENGAGAIAFASGLWFATPAAINSVTIFSGSGGTSSGLFTQYSSFALYGIKGA
jgi:hypothetical protein